VARHLSDLDRRGLPVGSPGCLLSPRALVLNRLDLSATVIPVSGLSRPDAIRSADCRVVGDGGSKDGRGYQKYHG